MILNQIDAVERIFGYEDVEEEKKIRLIAIHPNVEQQHCGSRLRQQLRGDESQKLKLRSNMLLKKLQAALCCVLLVFYILCKSKLNSDTPLMNIVGDTALRSPCLLCYMQSTHVTVLQYLSIVAWWMLSCFSLCFIIFTYPLSQSIHWVIFFYLFYPN